MEHMQRRRVAALTFACTLAACAAVAQEAAAPQPSRGLTLDAALAAALTNSPRIAAAAASVAEARGRLTAARTYALNPEIELESAERSAPGRSGADHGVRVSQEVEIGGQRGKRTAVAEAALDAAEARLERRRLEVASVVTQIFADTLRTEGLRELAASELELVRQMMELERRRLEAGAGTQIAVNVARAAAGRAVRRLRAATADVLESRARLAEAIGLPAAAAPRPEGVAKLPPPLSDASWPILTSRALADRWDLRALRAEVEQAHRQVTLERALARPDLRVSVFSERDEGADVTGAAFAIPIPLFDRNRGGIVVAEAAVDRAEAELEAAELAAGREVAAAFAHYQGALTAARELEELVVGSLEESLELLRRALEAGKVSTTEVLLMRRELFDARREALESVGEALVARAELELALGAALDEEAIR